MGLECSYDHDEVWFSGDRPGKILKDPVLEWLTTLLIQLLRVSADYGRTWVTDTPVMTQITAMIPKQTPSFKIIPQMICAAVFIVSKHPFLLSESCWSFDSTLLSESCRAFDSILLLLSVSGSGPTSSLSSISSTNVWLQREVWVIVQRNCHIDNDMHHGFDIIVKDRKPWGSCCVNHWSTRMSSFWPITRYEPVTVSTMQ